MVALTGLSLILLKFFIGLIVGIALLVVLLVVLYFTRDNVRDFLLLCWSFIHNKSYRDHIRREEAEKKFKENAE